MTDHRHGDGEIVPGLSAQLPEDKRIGVFVGDGATTPEASTRPPSPSRPTWSYRPGATASHGRGEPLERPSATRRSAPSGISSGGCGNDGAATIAAVWPRRQCHASSASLSALQPATRPSRRGPNPLRYPQHLQCPWYARHRRCVLIKPSKTEPPPHADFCNSASPTFALPNVRKISCLFLLLKPLASVIRPYIDAERSPELKEEQSSAHRRTWRNMPASRSSPWADAA